MLVLRMSNRISWKETKQEPGTAEPDNMLGCCLVSLRFLWAILSTSTVQVGTISKFRWYSYVILLLYVQKMLHGKEDRETVELQKFVFVRIRPFFTGWSKTTFW